jgi:hypothetical protein
LPWCSILEQALFPSFSSSLNIDIDEYPDQDVTHHRHNHQAQVKAQLLLIGAEWNQFHKQMIIKRYNQFSE